MSGRPLVLLLPVVAMVLLAGCVTNPQMGAGIHVTPRGVSVAPAVSARVGGARIAVSP